MSESTFFSKIAMPLI